MSIDHDHDHDHDDDAHHDDDVDEAILAFWDAYCTASGTDIETPWAAYAFGGPGVDDDVVDELADLVAKGIKRATTALLWEHEAEQEPLPEPGDMHIILNAAGQPRAIVRTSRVDVLPICDVDDEFAAVEGEGDGSLEYWQEVHYRIFNELARQIGRSPTLDMPVVCERFEVVYTGAAA